MSQVARQTGLSAAQVALQWGMQRGHAVIPKVRADGVIMTYVRCCVFQCAVLPCGAAVVPGATFGPCAKRARRCIWCLVSGA